MAEYLVKGESLTAIADKIRVLSGTEDAMGLDDMVEHVGEANTDVVTEAGLIEQISAALEGKAGGNGSGANIEACTVTIEYYNADFGGMIGQSNATIYSSVLDSSGNIQPVTLQSGVDFVFEEGLWGSGSATIVLENVVKNSILAIIDNSPVEKHNLNTNFDTIYNSYNDRHIFIIFINQDGNITIS